ncbi:TPA: phage tail protein [Salmonella enterica]
MAKNDFKPFATGKGANVTSQSDWEALPALLSGFTAGKASSAQVNKALRQASFIAAALAQYTASRSEQDVLDDGDLSDFIAKMSAAFGKDFQTLDATLTALAGLATGADKLPYFTGNDTAGQTDLTSVGRDIIGKGSIADILTYLGLEETINLAKNAVPATRRVNNKPLSGDITLWAADVKAISADTVGEITDNGTMASANTPGWWRVAVSNPDTVADFPTWPDGSKLYGYGYLFVEKFGNTWFQHYYAHRGANAKRQDWGSVPNTSRPWIIDYNTENKPSAGEVGAVSAGGGDYNKNFRFGAVGTLGDESNPVQLISAAANQAADNFVAWTSYTWYQDYVRTGVVRAGDTTIKSFAVEINGVRFLEIGRDGTLLNGNMASDLRLGQEESISMSIPGYGQSVDCVVPSGCYVTGLTSTSTGSYIGTTKIFYRRLQRKVAGNWVDASWL